MTPIFIILVYLTHQAFILTSLSDCLIDALPAFKQLSFVGNCAVVVEIPPPLCTLITTTNKTHINNPMINKFGG